ncbi:hypothetical protein [Mycolicibacterium brumae]|nr:hypothetical protein [Mycolicibacterium brumae]MCV7191521.1 hypothetical protein [Mycolicibacterium brumae]UWW09372.1 hypothetical protein L2Z93_002468 [Mycolicibacterium brumae]
MSQYGLSTALGRGEQPRRPTGLSVAGMPSQRHEALVQLFRDQPEFAPLLLHDVAGLALPDHDALASDSPDLSQAVSWELRADNIVTLTRDGRPVLGIIIESQLRVDPKKHDSWPGYMVALRHRLRCDCALVVVCVTDAVASWAGRPITLGPGSVITPIVIGPSTVPVITDPEHARGSPELTALSALTHPNNHAILDALFASFDPDNPVSPRYAELIYSALPAAGKHYLEKLMTTRTREYTFPMLRDSFNEGAAKGEAKGKAEDVLAVLTARGHDVPDDLRARVTNCTDTERLTVWLIRAATADSVEDVFG